MAAKPRRIVVGMSGGVDSSVALLLLKKQGWEPIGVSLKMAVWGGKCNSLRENSLPTERYSAACCGAKLAIFRPNGKDTPLLAAGRLRSNSCCTEESFANAARVCRQLGAPHHIYNVEKRFEKRVIGYFLGELAAGRTPNPCLVCNRDLKVRALFEWAKKHGIRHVATGHYAITRNGRLLRAADMGKDQTYGLCLIPRRWLSSLILPLGNLTKQQAYGIAIRNGLGFFRGVRQSQDLCFVSESAMKPFLFEKLGKREGDIVDEEGRRIGTHYGLFLYTIGQRRGLGLPSAHFVKGFDVKRNALIVTGERKNVLANAFAVKDFNWLVQPPRAKEFCAMAQIRTHQKEVKARIVQNGKALEAKCGEPIEGIAPGQVCALYKGKVCLGGGAIGSARS